MNLIFGTDGIRGPVNTFITPEACLKIGHATGLVMKELGWNTVVIGKDTRNSGYMLEAALQAGFIASGVNVRLLGPLPTPGVAYLTKTLRNNFGLVISASHNEFYDNGIKIFNEDGEKISHDIEKRIEKHLSNIMTPIETSLIGKAYRFDESGPRYIEFCKSTVPPEINFSSLRIVLDCANGACYKVTPEVFEELGAEVICIGAEPDGYNINQDCGSMHPEVIKKAVIDHSADFGVSLDGDGDRVILIDEKGNLLDGDDLLYILAFANPNRTGAWSGVVGTLMSNPGLEDGIKKLGYKFERADVGDKHVSSMLAKKGWLLGGETSGHIICKDLVSTGDGTIAALKVISSLLILEKKASEVLANFSKIPSDHVAVRVDNTSIIKSIINDKDFLSLVKEIESDMTVARVIVRPSGTEPLIRIHVEAIEKKVAKKYVKDIADFINNKL